MIYKIMNLFCDITFLVLFASCTLTSSSTRFSNTQLHIASPITANYSQIMVRSRLACAAQCDRLPQCTAFNTTRVTMETGESASKWQTLCTLIEETRESLISSPGDDTLFVKASDVIQTGEIMCIKQVDRRDHACVEVQEREGLVVTNKSFVNFLHTI